MPNQTRYTQELRGKGFLECVSYSVAIDPNIALRGADILVPHGLSYQHRVVDFGLYPKFSKNDPVFDERVPLDLRSVWKYGIPRRVARGRKGRLRDFGKRIFEVFHEISTSETYLESNL